MKKRKRKKHTNNDENVYLSFFHLKSPVIIIELNNMDDLVILSENYKNNYKNIIKL